jgi:hypothetical protein
MRMSLYDPEAQTATPVRGPIPLASRTTADTVAWELSLTNSTVTRSSSGLQAKLAAHQQHIESLLDLCVWGIATGRVWLIARAWLALEREVWHA